MDIVATLSTVEKILSVAGPLVTMMVQADQKEAAEKVLDGVEVAVRYARIGISGVNDYAAELQKIHDDMLALSKTGGAKDSDFNEVADRIAEKSAALHAAAQSRHPK